MKFLVVIFAFVGLALSADLRSSRQYSLYQPEKYARILKNDFELRPDGTYNYIFETENGINAEQKGYPRNLGGNPPEIAETVLGTFSWISPEGKFISIGYSADENGYHPVGDAIPTPPPIPDYILRSIEYNKQEEARRKNRF